MLKIQNLHARVAGKEILKGLNLEVAAGEVHAIMGPNGAGKSTLGNVLAGREGYEVTQGTVTYGGLDLLALAPEQRAAAGIFLAFQYPVEIPGVNNTYFLRAALNAQRRARGEAELDSIQFLRLVREKLRVLHISDELLHRAVNEGFSGGEKKRNEIFQMAVLEPKLAILDETDSGLDIDALKLVADGVNKLRDPARAFVVITHYQRLLDYIVPDRVHVLADGRIVESGDRSLALELEAHGYGWVSERRVAGAG
jgi:Fe-S cluster assembly ATP-binding protein